MNDNPPPPRGFYSRICPCAEKTPDDTRLEALAAAMKEDGGGRDSLWLTAGYTYFGQFIDHDLTWNRARLTFSSEEQLSAPNFRTARLDLDHVYGDGPKSEPLMYEGKEGKEHFRLGKTLGNSNLGLPGGTLRDVPFNDGHAVMGDQADFRNAENLILRQLHVLFLKFHNRAVEQVENDQVKGDLPEGASCFDRARKLVMWNYQWLVWNDFLNRVLSRDVMRPPLGIPAEGAPNDYSLPMEFSLAAFRFGHSMVRDFYALNCHRQNESLLSLFNSNEDGTDRLKEDDLVEWGRFFRGLRKSGRVVLPARSIDIRIADALHALPIASVKLFTGSKGSPTVLRLPERTLKRGARCLLASGQQAEQCFGIQGVTAQEFQEDSSEAGKTLRAEKLTDNVPLWYYILKEAELRGRGNNLGPIGSRIVRDTIESALLYDPESFVRNKGNDWQPPFWLSSNGDQTQIRNISSLIRFVGDSELPQGCQATIISRLLERFPRFSGILYAGLDVLLRYQSRAGRR